MPQVRVEWGLQIIPGDFQLMAGWAWLSSQFYRRCCFVSTYWFSPGWGGWLGWPGSSPTRAWAGAAGQTASWRRMRWGSSLAGSRAGRRTTSWTSSEHSTGARLSPTAGKLKLPASTSSPPAFRMTTSPCWENRTRLPTSPIRKASIEKDWLDLRIGDQICPGLAM